MVLSGLLARFETNYNRSSYFLFFNLRNNLERYQSNLLLFQLLSELLEIIAIIVWFDTVGNLHSC